MCKQEVICWDKMVQKNGVLNKEDPKMKKINFTNVGKTLKREQILSSLYCLMLKNVKFFVIIQDWLKGRTFRTTQDFIILSSLTTLRNCYYDLFTENMSTEYSQSQIERNYFITGLENYLRTIRRKYRMLGRTKIIV